MHRVITTTNRAVGLTAPSKTVESAPAPERRRLPRWLLAVGFWTLIVLIYSTRAEVRAGPYVWEPISWVDSLKAAASQWYAWGLLSVGIYWVNRLLPVGRDALVQRFIIHVPLSLVFTTAYTYLNHALIVVLDAPTDAGWVSGSVLETAMRVTYRLGMFVYWAIVAICVALEYQSDLKDRQLRNAELERLLSEARLTTLRQQLDPHFLFNTLNSVSAYLERDPRRARLMLEQLGELLRMTLEWASEQETPLARELAFVDRYAQLQLVRFGDRLNIDVDVESDALDAAVPTFILQPLVENAIRHGVSKLTGPGRIELVGRRVDDELHLSVSDNGPGLPPDWTPEGSGGIGLANTRERLEHLYGPGQYRFTIAPRPAGGVRAEIVVPYRAA